MFTSIVIALDLESVGDHALPVAASLAELGGLDVELVTVSSPHMPDTPDLAELERRATAHELEKYSCTVIHSNDPGPALVAHLSARPDALLVMGTSAKGPLSSLLVGSVTEYVLGHGGVPVLVVGPQATGRPLLTPTLIAGVGVEDRGDVLLPAIRSWAETFDTKRTWIVHIHEAPVMSFEYDNERRASANVQSLTDRLHAAGVPALGKSVTNGDPASGIEEFAIPAIDPVLVAVSARWADVHRHRHSVTRRLVANSTRPVLVVPAVAQPQPPVQGSYSTGQLLQAGASSR